MTAEFMLVEAARTELWAGRVLPGGRRIEVHADFDTSTFERLVGILERRKPCLDWAQLHGPIWPRGSPTCANL